DAGPWPAEEVLATSNALIHLPSLVEGKAQPRIDPAPNFFSFNRLDYDFHLGAPPPNAWRACLSQLWPNDPDSITTRQQWVGYMLRSDTRQQKIVLIVGPKRSGKGTIARVLRGLVGPANVAGPTLSSLGTNFGLWPLLNKSVAIISDARL